MAGIILSAIKGDDLVVIDAIAEIVSIFDQTPFTTWRLTRSILVTGGVAQHLPEIEASGVAHFEPVRLVILTVVI